MNMATVIAVYAVLCKEWGYHSGSRAQPKRTAGSWK
jgi:hypothetical protein